MTMVFSKNLKVSLKVSRGLCIFHIGKAFFLYAPVFADLLPQFSQMHLPACFLGDGYHLAEVVLSGSCLNGWICARCLHSSSGVNIFVGKSLLNYNFVSSLLLIHLHLQCSCQNSPYTQFGEIGDVPHFNVDGF